MRAWLAPLLMITGCGASPTTMDGAADLARPTAGGDLASAGSPDAATPPDLAAAGCPRAPRAPDLPRKVVVSHPFAGPGMKGKTFEVLDLAPAGALARTGVTFTMGTANEAPIRFTSDGEIGIVAQEDGTLGVFRIDGAGMPKVVHAAFKGPFYAGDVILYGDGSRGFVLDGNTDNNGGGIYEIGVRCDGTIESRGKVLGGGRANAMALLQGARGAGILAAGGEAKLVDLAGMVKEAAKGMAFPDDEAIPSSVATTPDGRYALITDDGIVAGNRLAVVLVESMKRVSLLMTPNPSGVVASPFGNALLLMNAGGTDALRVMKYDPANGAAPVAIVGEVAYKNGKAQLPYAAVVIERGMLRGRVLVAENAAVRQLQFSQAGGVEDVGLTSFGGGIPNIVGTVGVQP